jgi:hypothetical protein
MPRLAPPIDLPRSARNEQPAEKLTSDQLTLGDALAQWFTYLRSSDRIGSARTLTREGRRAAHITAKAERLGISFAEADRVTQRRQPKSGVPLHQSVE